MKQNDDQTNDLIYTERISSNKTEALFLALMIFFLLLLIWRVNIGSWDVLAVVFLCFFVFFFCYSVNYRTSEYGIYACPVCKRILRYEENALRCPICSQAYPIKEGIPDFVLEDLSRSTDPVLRRMAH